MAWTFAPGDFDGDGDLDAAAYNPANGSVRVAVSTGNQTFAISTEWANVAPDSRWTILSGQFTNDSRMDLFGYHPDDGSVWVFRNSASSSDCPSGAPCFVFERWATMSPIAGWSFAAGDFNNDGRLDVAGYHSSGVVRTGINTVAAGGQRSFTFSQWATVTPAAGWVLSSGNFTGEGGTDVVVQHPVDGSVYVGRSTGSAFTFAPWGRIGKDTAVSLLAAPFGAGTTSNVIDLGVYLPDGSIWVGHNMGSSFTFNRWGTVSPPSGFKVAAGDFTMDGRPDVLAYYPPDGSIAVGDNNISPAPLGYAWPLSAAAGQTIQFMTSGLFDPTVRFYRYGTSAQLKAEQPPAIKSIVQGIPNPALPERGIPRGAEWRPTFGWQIPSTWTSGLYSARLEQPDPADPSNPAKRRKYDIPFVVKATNRKKIAVLANVNTWDAYNRWNGTAGGRSKYDGLAHTSFLRPSPTASPVLESDGHLTRTERYVLGWLEDNNYLYDLYTDIDFHDGAVTFARGYRKLVLTGHPEYWTTTMRQRLKEFLDAGGSLVYLGGNGLFEAMEYGDQAQCNGGSGTCVHAQSTYMAGHDAEINCGDAAACRAAARPWRAPVMFRALEDSQGHTLHELELLGVATAICSGESLSSGEPYLVREPTHGLFAGIFTQQSDTNRPFGVAGHPTSTGLYGGGASGHEIDRIDPDAAAGVPCPPLTDVLIDHLTPFQNFTAPANRVLLASAANGADMTFYRIPNKGFVFAAGSIIFGRSLAFPTTTNTTQNWEIRRLMQNVMNLPDLP